MGSCRPLPLDGSISDSLQVAAVADLSSMNVRPGGESARMTDPAASADDAFDYGDDALPDEKAIAQAFEDLDQLARRAERASADRKRAEEQLEKCKKAEEQLLTKDIPDLMEKMRMGDYTTSSGIEVKVKRDIKLSLPGHERIEARMGALKWLVDRGHGGVIKNSVSVTLERGEDDRANDLVVALRGQGYAVES